MRSIDMDLGVTQTGRVLHLLLNRTQKRNALSLAMCAGIADAVEQAQTNSSIGSILISAAGKAFCSGMDLDEARVSDDSKLVNVHERLFTVGVHSIKPMVVAVNGAALGGGLGLVAQGHIVIAAEGAVFALPEIRVGLWPFLIYRAMERALGPGRTLELSLTGRSFDTPQAYSWGLVHRIAPDAELADRAEAAAAELAEASPVAIEAGFTYVRETIGKSWEEAGRIAASLRDQVMTGKDFPEGVLAFKEKRKPHWPSMPPGSYSA